MPIWTVIVLVLVAAAVGWVNGALSIGAFMYSKLARRVGRLEADRLLRPGDG